MLQSFAVTPSPFFHIATVSRRLPRVTESVPSDDVRRAAPHPQTLGLRGEVAGSFQRHPLEASVECALDIALNEAAGLVSQLLRVRMTQCAQVPSLALFIAQLV